MPQVANLEAVDHRFPADFSYDTDQLVGDRLLVDDSLPEELRTEAGLIVTQGGRKDVQTIWGSVLKAGPDVRVVREGERVAFHSCGGYEVVIGRQKLRVLREGEILLRRERR